MQFFVSRLYLRMSRYSSQQQDYPGSQNNTVIHND
jgi:hypothetical protein